MTTGPASRSDAATVAPRFFPVSGALRAAADAWRAGPGGPPAPARASATVMLVRDGAGGGASPGAEVFMLRRTSSMAFAPNMMVFPGGGVDARDADADLPWVGPDPADWASWLNAADEAVARELVVAAAREVFEECGVLLAGPDAGSVVADLSAPEWDVERDRLLSRDQSFAELLIRRDLVLRTDLLAPWAHWVTPEFEPRRYDTRFFAAVLPAGQVPDDRSSEADHADWVVPARLLDEVAAGSALMLPPTIVAVEQIARASSAQGLLASPPTLLRVMPVLEDGPDGGVLRCDLPVDPGRA